MNGLYCRLSADLVALLVKRILADHAEMMAEGYLQDLGEDDCRVCIANRQRDAWDYLEGMARGLAAIRS